MRLKTKIILIFFSANLIKAQNDKSVQGAFGAVTIDGKIWNQLALRPILPYRKLSIALDLVFYMHFF